MNPSSPSRKREVITGVAILIVIVLIGAAVAIGSKKDTPTSTTSNTTSSSPSATSNTSTPSSSATYKDGTYSATGTYSSPGGTESIKISLTLQNDVVTDTSAEEGAIDNDGREYQEDFISGYKSQVVGKNISDLNLGRVSGSSLTSEGFNAAVAKIKQQAQS